MTVPPLTSAEYVRRFKPTEKQTQVRVVRILEAYGAIVCNLSQPRNTMQAPGLGDLFVFLPRHKRTAWIEVKRPGGKQSDAQKGFEVMCRSCNQDYVCGGVQEVLVYLESLGEKVVR